MGLIASPFVVVELVAFLGMLATSIWGWKHIEPETRVRVRGGLTGLDWTISKTTTLVLTPLIGLLVIIATLALGDSPSRETVAWLGVAVMVIFLWTHWYSVRRAAR